MENKILDAATPLENLQEFIEYWDEWHLTWNDWAKNRSDNLKMSSNENIMGWAIPESNGNQEEAIWRYFPEPYWGDVSNKHESSKLKGLFINLNPGMGGSKQDIKSQKRSAEYFSEKKYHEKILDFSKDTINNATTKWFIKNRARRIHQLTESKLSDMTGVLGFEMIPWHTQKISIIPRDTVIQSAEVIFNKILYPASKICQDINSPLKGIVLIRGSIIDWIKGYLRSKNISKSEIKIDENKSSWKIEQFTMNYSKFLCFKGQVNTLPRKEVINLALNYSNGN